MANERKTDILISKLLEIAEIKYTPAAARILSRGNGLKPDRFLKPVRFKKKPLRVVKENKNRVTENCNKE